MTNSPPRLSRFYSVAEVAELLGVSRKTVSRWIKDRHLYAHTLGRQVRISENDILSFTAMRRR